ncbi:hypothetical protein GCM10023152_35390 [Agromyces bauzanensis]|uniref:3'-phosphate/5'-hydroxy nucleic acid ligase n=1 Tax=Agromyces bauzanensis TaxID=1308924 RepID=A0A917PW65_9MICO|nr:hypothetical protein GCM10011372_36350 [Agromyces bauzanensis]
MVPNTPLSTVPQTIRSSTSAPRIEFRDTDAFVDEIPQAYKPIDRVMADAASLVSVRHTLRQIVNVKGD